MSALIHYFSYINRSLITKSLRQSMVLVVKYLTLTFNRFQLNHVPLFLASLSELNLRIDLLSPEPYF